LAFVSWPEFETAIDIERSVKTLNGEWWFQIISIPPDEWIKWF
jgi:hypothetical protein